METDQFVEDDTQATPGYPSDANASLREEGIQVHDDADHRRVGDENHDHADHPLAVEHETTSKLRQHSMTDRTASAVPGRQTGVGPNGIDRSWRRGSVAWRAPQCPAQRYTGWP